MLFRLSAVWLLLAIVAPAAAQDVRGLEICTAEKTMERRTGCLQSNDEFLQQALAKSAKDTQAKLGAADRELKAQRAEIAALKESLERLQRELAELKKPPAAKK